MVPLNLLTKLFRGESSPIDAEGSPAIRFINIELEELDHDGRRSVERRRRRRTQHTAMPVAVSPLPPI